MYAIGSDHGGYALKQEIMKHLSERGIAYRDYGTYSEESCDYPDYGEAVGRAVASGECERGIVVCGTGIGFSAQMAREHNDANVLALGARVLGAGLALKIVDTFLDSAFAGGRHERRVAKLMAIEGGE